MSWKLAIASGKGGTGKTTVSVNLYHYIAKKYTSKVQLVDCDVEEPNDAIFFSNAEKTHEEDIIQLIPEIDRSKCTFCRKCVEYCEFNAIVVIPPAEFAEVNASLCHSCGACSVACKEDAIREKPHQIGTISCYDPGYGEGIMEGRLKIGSAMQTLAIKELKKRISGNHDVVIYDAPPGTSCPVVETIADSDYVMLVTEPTPFGLYDLKLTVELLKDVQKPFGIIINKAGLGDHKVYNYLSGENLELLGEIPFDREYAGMYAKAELLNGKANKMEGIYARIFQKLEKKITKYEGDHYFKW